MGWLVYNPSEACLACYFKKNEEVPNISVDVVMKAAGLIEQMGRERMKLREEQKETP
jgi:PP-loop superfamily ATP-utilizing enzyme